MNNKYICEHCIEEEYIQKYIEIYGSKTKCSYCGKTTKAYEFESVVEIIADGIEFIYDDPVNGLGYVDGEYVKGNGNIYDTYDLLVDVFELGGSKSFQDILNNLPNNLWCKKEFYGLDTAEEKIYTWEYFVNQVKYKTRYFFIKEKTSIRKTVPYLEPYNILDEFSESVAKFDLIDILNKDENILRARKNGIDKKYRTPKELGTPKAEDCIRPNRMSPAGIPMFYGSLTEETCLAELGNKEGIYTIGKWRIKENLKILNLTKHFKFNKRTNQYFYPRFPSVFDRSNRDNIFDYQFILRFASDLSGKVRKEGIENIEYVPTQIVAEYLRRVALFDKKKLDGICFYSSIDGGINYVLFIEQEECIKNDKWGLYNQKLELISYEEREIKKYLTQYKNDQL